MTIEYENFEELKKKLNDMGYYIYLKPKALGKLLPCKQCGRKMNLYSIRDDNVESDKPILYDDGKEYYPLVGRSFIKCRCGNSMYIVNNETQHNRHFELVYRWNKMNKKEGE